MAETDRGARVPPHNLEAERSALGSMILDNESIGDVAELVSADAFYKAAHRMIFEAIVALFQRGEVVDLVTVREEVVRRNSSPDVRIAEEIAVVADSVPSSAHAIHYAKIVRDKKTLRDLLAASEAISEEAWQGAGDVRELVDRAEQRLFDVARADVQGETASIQQLLGEAWERLDSLQGRKGRLTGIATGFYDLDDLTCGLQSTDLIVIAGRPSMGKTSLALTIADHVAIEGHPVAFFSLEMSKNQVANNLLCSRARVDSHKMRLGGLREEDWDRLHEAARDLSSSPLFVDDTASLSLMTLRAKARRLKARHGLKLAIVDYLQLMDAPEAESRQQEISRITRGLKVVARELSIPIIVLSQLNRAVENREDRRPRLADLRESGAIEQDADLILLLFREDYYREKVDEERKGVTEVIVAKQRNGPTGKVDLQFLAESMRFESAAFQRS